MQENTTRSEVSLLIAGPEGERNVGLDLGAFWTIGRADQNQVVVADDSVSRNHAMIQRGHSGEFYLMDLGSRNGSFVNGMRIAVPVLLKDQDCLSIGDVKIIFRSRNSPSPQPPPSHNDTLGQTRVTFSPRTVTVMVVDIRDFTKLAQQVDQSLLAAAIAAWFRQSGKKLREFGCYSQKYIGDAIMSVWVHDYGTVDVLPVLRGYLEIASIAADLGHRFPLPWPLRIGAGINTGLASLGNAGSSGQNDFTALGDSVNAAFRIESVTKEIGADLALGKETYEKLGTATLPASYFTPHLVQLKGYDQSVTVWASDLGSVRGYVDREKIDK